MTGIVAAALLATSSSLAASVITKATLVAATALIVSLAMRTSRASARHLVFTAAFAALLVIPLATAAVPSFDLAMAMRATSSDPLPSVQAPFESPATPARSPAPPKPTELTPLFRGASVTTLLWLAWAAGAVVCLLPVISGLRGISRVRRGGVPWVRGQAMLRAAASDTGVRRAVDVLSHDSVPGPMTCGVARPAIVFPPDARSWPDADLRRAIVHELEHVRRGDWIVQCLARIACALYWFHPLVWMCWRRIRLEAERACDDAVIRQSDPTLYAEQLVTLARRVATTRSRPLVAMASRRDLPMRISAVLDVRQRRGRVGTTTALVAVLASVAVGGVVAPLRVVASASPSALPAQVPVAPPSQTTAPASAPAPAPPPAGAAIAVAPPPAGAPPAPQASFEVASVKPNRSGFAGARRVSVGFQPGGRFTATNITARELIKLAYGSGAGMDDARLLGAPGWTENERFDVEATAGASAGASQFQPMLRSLLAERFGLVLRTETREMPVYALVLASPDGRLGPRLQRSEDCTAMGTRKSPAVTDDPAAMCGGGGGGPGTARFGGIPLSIGLLPGLSREVQRIVVDRTGLTGFFNGSLEWTPRSLPAPAPDAPLPPADAPSIFAAVQEQLGLKLEPSTAPVEVFVIESVRQPTPN